MSRGVGLLLAPLDSEDAYPEIRVDKQVAWGVSNNDLDLLDLLLLDDLLVHEGLLHVNVQNSQVALLVRDKKLLESRVPEDGGINALVGIPDSKKFGTVRCIEPFEVLIMWNSKDEVSLNDNQNLHNSDSMQVLILFGQLENTLLRSPVLWCFEFQKRPFWVTSIESNWLTLFNVEASHPYIVVHRRRVYWGEILDNLKGNEPRVHQ